MSALSISGESRSIKYFLPCLEGPVRVRLNADSRKAIRASHSRLKQLLKKGKKIYGVTTGFGDLSKVTIDAENRQKLQLNLVRSHATGVGKSFDLGITRLILLLKLSTWAKGVSGVRLELVTLVRDLLNHDILPVIPRQGSVGASGDLAPLAHLSLIHI